MNGSNAASEEGEQGLGGDIEKVDGGDTPKSERRGEGKDERNEPPSYVRQREVKPGKKKSRCALGLFWQTRKSNTEKRSAFASDYLRENPGCSGGKRARPSLHADRKGPKVLRLKVE